MKRTTVMLPDDLALLLDQERRRRDVSAAEIVREALDAYFRRRSPVMRIAALGRSGRSDISANIEEILAEEWGSEEGQNRFMFGTPTRPESQQEVTSTRPEPPTSAFDSVEPALEDPL